MSKHMNLELVEKAEFILNRGRYSFLSSSALHLLMPDFITLILKEADLEDKDKLIMLNSIQSAIESRYADMPFDVFTWGWE